MRRHATVYLLVKIILYADWYECVVGQTVLPSRGVSDIANPLVDPEKCHRKDSWALVCDPDDIITVGQAYQLDVLIRNIYNDTQCPCDAATCKPNSEGGYVIGIAIVRAMKLSWSVRMLNLTSENRARYMDAVLGEAQKFAYGVLDSWKLGRCKEDILIFYSQADSVLYTVTNSEARKKLTDEIVAEIALNSRIHFSHRDSVAHGLTEMLNDYRDVLMGNYKQKFFRETVTQGGMEPHRVYGSGSKGRTVVRQLLFLLVSLALPVSLH